jgi:hypothetical protein
MISAQQLKQALDIVTGAAFSNDGTVPTATFTANPNSYPVGGAPGSISLAGTIAAAPNSILAGWQILNGNTVLATGLANNLAPAYTVPTLSVPTLAGSYTYTLNVQYKLTQAQIVPNVISYPATVVVSASGYAGQLPLPGDNILVPGDLTPFLGGLTPKTQQEFINLFSIVAANTGRITIVVPDSFGTVLQIQDNTDSNVMNQFNLVADPLNTRKIYTTINALTPNTYYYKLVF